MNMNFISLNIGSKEQKIEQQTLSGQIKSKLIKIGQDCRNVCVQRGIYFTINFYQCINSLMDSLLTQNQHHSKKKKKRRLFQLYQMIVFINVLVSITQI